MTSEKERLLERGFLVFPAVVPPGLCEAVIAGALPFVDDSTIPYGKNPNMVEVYHLQPMWDVRQHRGVHEVFTGLFDTHKLWVSIDRVCVQPPACGGRHPFEMSMHWDVCPNLNPRPFRIQGLVALRDTDEDMGGFERCPDLYRNLDSWLASLPNGRVSANYFDVLDSYVYYCHHSSLKVDRWPVERVPLRRGDLLVWDAFLPHRGGVNRGKEARYAQYLTMRPVGDAREAEERVVCWARRRPPPDLCFPGDLLEREKKNPPARLTWLGRLLLGLEEWWEEWWEELE